MRFGSRFRVDDCRMSKTEVRIRYRHLFIWRVNLVEPIEELDTNWTLSSRRNSYWFFALLIVGLTLCLAFWILIDMVMLNDFRAIRFLRSALVLGAAFWILKHLQPPVDHYAYWNHNRTKILLTVPIFAGYENQAKEFVDRLDATLNDSEARV